MSVQEIGTAAEIEERVEVAGKIPENAFEIPHNAVVNPLTVEMAFENEMIPQSFGALAFQKVVDEKNAALLRVKLLQQELQKYKEKELAWKKSRNILKCKVQRRDKVMGKLQAVVASFEEDTKSEEHAGFILKKLEGLPRKIFENKMKNRQRKPNGRRYELNMKQFALTLYYYLPVAYNFSRLVSHGSLENIPN